MASCGECIKFFASENDPQKGDCVQRVVDARQGYFKAKPVQAGEDAGACPEFEKGGLKR
jgi:benzylsuccinate synthase